MDESSVGSYAIKYRVSLQEYPDREATESEDSFVVAIVDPCDSPIDLTSAEDELVMQEYTIS